MVLRAEQMPRRRYRLNQFDIDLHTIEHESTTYGAGRVRFTLNSAHLIGVAVYTDSNGRHEREVVTDEHAHRWLTNRGLPYALATELVKAATEP